MTIKNIYTEFSASGQQGVGKMPLSGQDGHHARIAAYWHVPGDCKKIIPLPVTHTYNHHRPGIK